MGTLAQRFGCLLGTMRQVPENVAIIIRAAVCLHTLLSIKSPCLMPGVIDQEDSDHNVQPSFWRRMANTHDMDQHMRGSADEKRARKLRMYLTHYLNSPTVLVPWQNGKTGRPIDA